ncbi:hypothetical protein L2E82_14116 [Cichorium intybus]|uniref:Uncharacterized protein n=1 Tax=Cichorium intybus TaxID=13427 RepID=A0ACB9EZQ0_CICIN|nr:hypothetical protein L2E82_14116 [Cichorium intybus]
MLAGKHQKQYSITLGFMLKQKQQIWFLAKEAAQSRRGSERLSGGVIGVSPPASQAHCFCSAGDYICWRGSSWWHRGGGDTSRSYRGVYRLGASASVLALILSYPRQAISKKLHMI